MRNNEKEGNMLITKILIFCCFYKEKLPVVFILKKEEASQFPSRNCFFLELMLKKFLTHNRQT